LLDLLISNICTVLTFVETDTFKMQSNRSLYLPGVSDEEWKLLAAILLGSHRQTSSAGKSNFSYTALV